jgi:hypothetical protein
VNSNKSKLNADKLWVNIQMGLRKITCEVDWSESICCFLVQENRLRVFENRVLRRIFGPKREKVARGWRKLHSEELNNLYASQNMVMVIKSRMRRWVGHVAHQGG